jgi:hypothetical protein
LELAATLPKLPADIDAAYRWWGDVQDEGFAGSRNTRLATNAGRYRRALSSNLMSITVVSK